MTLLPMDGAFSKGLRGIFNSHWQVMHQDMAESSQLICKKDSKIRLPSAIMLPYEKLKHSGDIFNYSAGGGS